MISATPPSRVRCPSRRLPSLCVKLNRNNSAISELVLQEEEVVGGCDGDDVLVRVPRRVKDLLVEVEAVDEDFVALALTRRRHLERRKKITPLTVIPPYI